MNSCEHYQELISRLVDGEVSHDEHEALMEHMKTCSRCNAMYAVFHDLSDILSEQPEALPAGLHENIMADVRRSDLRRKNRRMRTIGLRTALTAAACLVLVLFAASGFLPGRDAENLILSSEEAAVIPAPTEAPAAAAPSAPVVTAAPAPVPSVAPVFPEEAFTAQQNSAPAAPDTYLAAGDSMDTQYNTPQPIQNFQYQLATPAPVYTPTPVYTQPPVYVPETVYTPVDAEPEPVPELTASARRATAQPAELPAPTEEAPAEEWESFSLSLEDFDVFNAAAPDTELFAGDWTEDAGEPDLLTLELPEAEEDTAPDEGIVEEETELEPADKKDAVPRLAIRGKEARARLLALLAGSEEALPEEAELTRTVRLTLVPDDAYGSEEKLDILVYGDFVFYELHGTEGTKTYRAACSLAELDAFLKTAETAPTPVPSPTPDPYGA